MGAMIEERFVYRWGKVTGLTWVTIALIGLGGCAGLSDQSHPIQSSGQAKETPVPVPSEPMAHPGEAEGPTAHAFLVADREGRNSQTVKDRSQDDNYDPFARPGEEGVEEEYDPWESFNTSMFEFNRQVDRFVLKPVAQGYNFVLPDPVQIGIANLFFHIRFPQRFLNNLFQAKFRGAGMELGRFLINTGFGVGGLVDIAKDVDWQTPEEDTGQTLGFYGVKPGPYLVLPFLPPFTVRDFAGYIGDIALNPINWLVFPIIEVEGIPSLVAHKNRTTTSFVQIGSRAGEIVNDRSLTLEKFQGVEEATLDLYTAVRNAYLQKRARAVRE